MDTTTMADDQFNLIVKVETDKLKATKVLSAVLLDVDSGRMWTFADQPHIHPIQDAVEILQLAGGAVICHSNYPLDVLGRLHGLVIEPERVLDTLQLAKTLHPYSRNGLSEWAKRFRRSRMPFHGAPDWSPVIERRCQDDARLVHQLYQQLAAETQAAKGGAA